jgi:hypothetical protein
MSISDNITVFSYESNDFIKDFDDEHQKEGQALFDGSWFHYPDGAARERNPHGCSRGPLLDKHANATNILKYWQKRVGLATEEFTFYKQKLYRYAKNNATEKAPGRVPNKDEIEKLKSLKEVVRGYQQKAEKAELEFEATLPTGFRER